MTFYIDAARVTAAAGAHETWYLAQLKPNSAAIAERHLNRQGFQTFLPMHAKTDTRRGRFVTSMRPLFPGYIFVAFDAAAGLWRKINSTSGVTSLVRFGSAPAPVPGDLIGALMARAAGVAEVAEDTSFTQGERVKMRTGPFVDFIAEVESIAPDQRVWLLMDLMGGKTRVSASTTQVRRL